VVHATGRRKPSVTVRPLSDGQDAGAAASEDGAVPLPLERGLGRRNWQGTMLVAHPGRDLLVAIERPRRGSEVRYQLEVRRSPSAGITALDLGE